MSDKNLSPQDECELYLFGRYLETITEGADESDACRWVYGDIYGESSQVGEVK